MNKCVIAAVFSVVISASPAYAEPDIAIEDGVRIIDAESVQRNKNGGIFGFLKGTYFGYLAEGAKHNKEQVDKIDSVEDRIEREVGESETQTHKEIDDLIARCIKTGDC